MTQVFVEFHKVLLLQLLTWTAFSWSGYQFCWKGWESYLDFLMEPAQCTHMCDVCVPPVMIDTPTDAQLSLILFGLIKCDFIWMIFCFEFILAIISLKMRTRHVFREIFTEELFLFEDICLFFFRTTHDDRTLASLQSKLPLYLYTPFCPLVVSLNCHQNGTWH